MWKKPAIEMPDFKKTNLVELLEKDSLETNGGISIITKFKPFPIPLPGPTIPSGFVGPNFNLGVK